MVPGKGLEPSSLAALVPKTSVSTNFTTRAQLPNHGTKSKAKGQFICSMPFLIFAILKTDFLTPSMKKSKYSAFLLCPLLIVAPLTASAFYFGAQKGVVIDQAIEEDVYLAGQSIYLEESVGGDAALAGEKIVINGAINGDGLMAGAQITLKGEVQGDLRLAGQKVKIDGPVQEDVIAFGEEIEIAKGAENVFFGGERMSVEGTVENDLMGIGSTLYLNAAVEGDVKLSYIDQVIVGPQASIAGQLQYSSPQRIEELEEVTQGEVIYKNAENQPFSAQKFLFGLATSLIVFSFLSALLIGLILVGSFRYFGYRLTQAATKKPWISLGLGFLLVFILPFILTLLMGTIVAIPLILILLVGWIIIIYLSKIFASLLIAGKVFNLKEDAPFGQRFWTFALVLAIYDTLTFIPLLGMMNNNGGLVGVGSVINVAKLIVALISLGALMMYKKEVFKEMRKKKLV